MGKRKRTTKKPPKKYTRKVDRRMRNYGDIDFEKKVIRVNPRHGDLINTIIHEELHRKFPDKGERWIKKEAKKEESSLTMAQAAKLIKQYREKRDE